MKSHRTTVTAASPGVYIWECSCGDYDRHPMPYYIATSGAKRHRENIREMRRILGKFRPGEPA